MGKTWLICSTLAKDSRNANTPISIFKILVRCITVSCKTLHKTFISTMMIANSKLEAFHNKIIIKISLPISSRRINILEVSNSLNSSIMITSQITTSKSIKMRKENSKLLMGILVSTIIIKIKVTNRVSKRVTEKEIILLRSIKFNRKIKFASVQSLIITLIRILQYKIKEQQLEELPA